MVLFLNGILVNTVCHISLIFLSVTGELPSGLLLTLGRSNTLSKPFGDWRGWK